MLWKRIKLEDFEFPTAGDYKKDYIEINEELSLGVILNKIDKESNLLIDYIDIKDYRGLGDKFTTFVEKSFNSGIYLNIPKNIKIDGPIKVNFNMDNENPIVIDKNIIIANEGSEATIVFDYTTLEKADCFHNGITKVIAKENSIINIIKIQRINDVSTNFDTNVALVESNGKVNWISVELGASISGSNFSTYLEDEASESNLSSIYLGDGSRKLDLGYSMIHKGSRSISNIETRGVLMESARKVFRGNLDFKRGAKRASGVEEEYVILLDPTVKSDSIPALLCDEDDVQGEHAASAGQIDKNKLFYLMSRGLSERESKKLIIEAAFRPIIDKIPLEELQDIINSEISRRLTDA